MLHASISRFFGDFIIAYSFYIRVGLLVKDVRMVELATENIPIIENRRRRRVRQNRVIFHPYIIIYNILYH